jgi:hypothetical protein
VSLIFVAPIGYCLYDTSIPTEVGRAVIVLSFLLTAFILMDWYHLYASNSYRGILSGLGLGLGAAGAALTVVSFGNGAPVIDLALFESLAHWQGYAFLMKVYICGVGFAAVSLVSIPRLILIRMLSADDLPQAADA